MPNLRHITFQVDGMTCASCVGRAERALVGVSGVRSAAVNLANETALVTYDDSTNVGILSNALSNAGYPAVTRSIILDVENMTCASCVGRVERILANATGVRSVSVNLANETATVSYFERQTDVSTIVALIKEAGYPASFEGDGFSNRSVQKAERITRLGWLTIVAVIFALPVFVIEMGGHIFPPLHHWVNATIGVQTSRILQFALTSIVLFGPGLSFYTKGFPALLKGAPDMNSLVALGTSAAYGYSLFATFAPDLLPAGSVNVYFEAAATIVVLILLGRYFEARAKGRTGQAIAKLAGLRAKTARVEGENGITEIPIDDIIVGDIIHLRPGEKIAVDGRVQTGESFIDESLVTGEPAPLKKTKNMPVIGGTINGSGALTFVATSVGNDTMLAQIIQMVEQAQGAKLPIQGLVDKITMWFVPAVMFVATLTVFVWMVFGPDPALGFSLVAGVSVLIIACPCAMGLATPTSIMVGAGRAAEMGVLFRKGEALQQLSEITVIALDKTGTLTQGCPELTDFQVSEGFDSDTVLAQIAAIEEKSEHPVAQAIVRGASKRALDFPVVDKFKSLTGYGVQAMIDGHAVLIGADRLMNRKKIDLEDLKETAVSLGREGKTPLFAAIDGKIAAIIAVADPIKPTTKAAIASLQEKGIEVAMLTGDNRTTAGTIAAQIGIDRVFSELLPKDKVAALEELKSRGKKVVFVGDGINDAPALAVADVGIAIGTGADIAIEAADVVLISGDLTGVLNALTVSRKTIRNIRQNLFWAFGYNVILIPIAAGAIYPFTGQMLSPILAAGAMATSSVFVLTNALRLRWIKAAILH